ncbi:MAG TPA: zinc ribbon domain-containing protein [Syntrophobacteraceae bacterium]|nr:zinc ribbon domain-containing protein [Syntrophobacteraceae bacterium]
MQPHGLCPQRTRKGAAMPIYEFRCVQCGNVQEILVSSSNTEVEMKCEQCQGEVLERILSCVSYTMGSSSGEATGPKVTNKTCGPGKSCTTIDLPGYTR